MLSFIIGAISGAALVMIVMALMTVSGDCSRIEEAYYQGLEDGKAVSDKR